MGRLDYNDMEVYVKGYNGNVFWDMLNDCRLEYDVDQIREWYL